jgi:hypothetical protein
VSCGGSTRVRCSAKADCAPQGQVCGDLDPTTGDLFCIDPLGTGSPFGAPCSGSFSQSECMDRLCNSATLECSAPCNMPTDCPNSGGGLPVCAAFGVGPRVVSLCGTSCKSNNYCRPNDQVCGVTQETSGFVTGMCVAVKQNGLDLFRGGSPCGMDAECASGLCSPGVFGTGSMCATICQSNSDCPSPSQQCAPLNLNGGQPTNLYACQGGPVPLP